MLCISEERRASPQCANLPSHNYARSTWSSEIWPDPDMQDVQNSNNKQKLENEYADPVPPWAISVFQNSAHLFSPEGN